MNTVENKTKIQNIISINGVDISSENDLILNELIENEVCKDAIRTISENETLIIEMWKTKNRIAEIIKQQISLPNAVEGKKYQVKLDFIKLNLTDLIVEQYDGLNEIGLEFNKTTDSLEGIPTTNGDVKFKLLFKIIGESENSPLNEKYVSLYINPDPKSLFKDIPSNKENQFWKEDNVSIFDKLGDKHILVSSKRGRSHKNVGSFRDDDFAFKHFEKTGWSLIAVSDGAGSYSLSRKGSELACKAVVEYFEKHADRAKSKEFEVKLIEYSQLKEEVVLKEIEVLAKQNLYKATVFVHNSIKEFAEETFKTSPELFNNPKAKSNLDYFHATLIFTLFKKYDFGYVVLTFGVGDCPIAIMDKSKSETTLLNWLDVGEFGGGTRFVTQHEIFHSNEHPMATRFNFKIVEDFSYLFMMTDGIYDPKFEVEANLEKNEKWNEFLSDLEGSNEDCKNVVFEENNKEIANQLSDWLDFWCAGNHDDRTLAIVF